ncbi:MAG: tRNA-dihydrouridine synthase family protein [Lachnospiraceae bacterium]|nr:tRNA-dihydrouridine synthase family protein [Lachnospiraceae bacterium]
MNTKIYFAPMEGVGNYIYRNSYNQVFGNVDKYFAPFIYAGPNGIRNMKETKDILPENNEGINLVPQLLSNNSDAFFDAAKIITEYGYSEVNLNAGCPSKTVTTKGRGAGILIDTEKYENFLYEIFNKCTSLNIKLSIKTRIGYENPEEFFELMEIYNKFPIYELIIHPRTRNDLYKEKINYDAFKYGYDNSKNDVCYNGDITNLSIYNSIITKYSKISSVMIGRGLLMNPDLINQIRNNTEKIDIKKNLLFADILFDNYRKIIKEDNNLIFKLKEVWLYLVNSYENNAKLIKKIKKIKNINEYKSFIRELN